MKAFYIVLIITSGWAFVVSAWYIGLSFEQKTLNFRDWKPEVGHDPRSQWTSVFVATSLIAILAIVGVGIAGVVTSPSKGEEVLMERIYELEHDLSLERSLNLLDSVIDDAKSIYEESQPIIQ